MTLDEMRSYFAGGSTRPLASRKTALAHLRQAIERHEPEILRALEADLGRPAFEAYAFEIAPVLQEIATLEKNLGKWTKAEKVKTPLFLFSSTTEVRTVPHGLVLIIAPWNYPFLLLMQPLAAAVACGNVVAAKPSRRAPETFRIMKTILSEVFPDSWVSVFREVNLDDTYDYIFFTGSLATGKIIAEAAARNLTPVTLELGGKNPCIVDETANLDAAARRIAWGKCANAGQTCVAPDYLLVHDSIRDILVDKIAEEIEKFYGENPAMSPDYGKIITTESYNRLLGYCDPERILKQCGMHNPGDRRFTPVILSASFGDPITHEEIFGPILPVITWRTKSDLNELLLPTPLALYLFTSDMAFAEQMIARHPSGGVCINDVMIQAANGNAPFGGVGTSGMGCYHGKYSVDTFSRKQTVVHRKKSSDPALRYPPYTDSALQKIRKWHRRLF
ncbi:aldehyde dehydrogenase family protein [Methanorbis furvi]